MKGVLLELPLDHSMYLVQLHIYCAGKSVLLPSFDIHKKISNSNNSADVTMKATISVSSGENSCLDTIVSDQQIPRRASKRLAGIKAGPLPELKTI
ncbi:hypothetical protein QL285_059987 [Trifolium repens]|nr:hypothetical protein QL285_059987 [Trifolium repens]